MSKILKTLLATTLFAQVAVAQDSNPKPEVSTTAQQTATLSIAEMKSGAQQYKSEVATGVAQIKQMAETAQEKRDVIKLNCLNDKLVKASASQNVVDGAIGELEQATDSAAAMHQYSKITIANQQMQVLLAEANECVGDDLGHVGQTQNSTTVGGNVRKDNVTKPVQPVVVTTSTDPKNPNGVNTDAVRPPPGSPYMP